MNIDSFTLKIVPVGSNEIEITKRQNDTIEILFKENLIYFLHCYYSKS